MQTYSRLDEYLLGKKGVRKDYKAVWGWDRYLIDDKMFVAVCYDESGKEVYITLKLEPEMGIAIREEFPGKIIPGYYMNHEHWNSIVPDGTVLDDVLKGLLDRSYALVLKGFTKKRQAEILA